MRSFGDLLRRFQSDERGVFLVIFGLLAVVLIAAAGAVVDFTSIQQARTRAQLALDSAALGLQPTIFTTGVTAESLRTRVQTLLDERLENTSVTSVVGLPTIDTQSGQLRLEATITVPTAFVQLVGFPTVDARLVAEARRRQLNLEVAMVLDNSGSMASYNRISNLRSAATCAANILLNGDCDSTATVTSSTRTWVGIVPFTMYVKVGSTYQNASWMDTLGTSSTAKANFDNDNYDGNAFTSQVNRFDLYNRLSNVSWAGCIEARGRSQDSSGLYYDTSDSPPSSVVPESLFVPQFAPDQPSGYPNNYLSDTPSACPAAPTYTWIQKKTQCADRMERTWEYGNNCTGATVDTYEQTVNGVTTTASSSRPSQLNQNSESGQSTTYTNEQTSSYGSRRYSHVRTYTWTYDYSDRELQERLCKYVSGSYASGGSPNQNCTGTTILPLTDTKASVTSKINAMVADGGTNIQQGVMWGFHMLSPTEPLTEAGPYEGSRSKAMIVMTDGENYHNYSSAFTGAYYYTANGYPYTGRLTGNSTAALISEMNNRTLETCTNAKNAGIIIYTIGLSVPNQATRDMLTSCASDSSKAKFPDQASELTQVFEDIATQLSNLRLAE